MFKRGYFPCIVLPMTRENLSIYHLSCQTLWPRPLLESCFKHIPGAEGKICPICPGNDIARHPQCFNWLFFEMLFSTSRKWRVLLVGDMLRQGKQLIFSVVGIHNKSQPLRIVLKHSYPRQDLCNLNHVYTTAPKLHCGNSALAYLSATTLVEVYLE